MTRPAEAWKIADGAADRLGDLSTLPDPAVVAAIVAGAKVPPAR